MKKLGFATVIASALTATVTATVIGLAGTAQADSEHHEWLDRIHPVVVVPQVDTSVHQSH